MNNPGFKSIEFDGIKNLAGVNSFSLTPIKEKLIPPIVTREQATVIYASEADLLNVALFGRTAKEWHEQNPSIKGNIRDNATFDPEWNFAG